jgi:hypothetical protein
VLFRSWRWPGQTEKGMLICGVGTWYIRSWGVYEIFGQRERDIAVYAVVE